MKHIVSVLLLCLGISSVSAQEVYTSSGHNVRAHKEKKGYDPSRLIIGGGFIAGFATGYTDAGLSPIVGYRFTKNLSAGVGLGYEYFSEKYSDYSNDLYSYKSNIIYPSVWGRYMIFRNFFAEADFEYDIVNQNSSIFDGTSTIKETSTDGLPAVLLGVGIRQPIAGRVSIVAEVLYDVIQSNEYINPYYGEPIFRIGVCAGF